MRILSEPKSTLRLLLHTLTLGVVLLAASQSISESFSAQENAGTSLAPDAQVLALIPKALPGAEPFPDELRNRLANNLAARPADYEPRSKNLRADGTALYPNRLLLETSPYLQPSCVSWHSGARPLQLQRPRIWLPAAYAARRCPVIRYSFLASCFAGGHEFESNCIADPKEHLVRSLAPEC